MLAGFAIGLTVGLLLVPVVGRSAGDYRRSAWEEKFFKPMAYAAIAIRERYVEEVTPEEVLEGAYQGMLSKLDDYSSYIPPKMLEEFEGDTKGEFGGLGIQIRFYPLKKLLRVEQPILGTPASKAGILAGDVITKVREEATGQEYDTTKFNDVHDAVRVLRGDAGTKVTITVVHETTRKEETITITRAVIKVPAVRAVQMVDDEHKIGYIYLAYFHESTRKDLLEAVAKLQQDGMKALIMDVRFNPGGLLVSSVEVSDVFLADQLVVSTRGRAEDEKVFRAETGDALGGAPLLLLVNRYSASASEIVAGAIKDNKRGLLVGEKTFGKGSVQTIIPLQDRKSALKLTTAKYYTPRGVCIENTGIKPDIVVAISDEDTRKLVQVLGEDYPPKPKKEELEDIEIPVPVKPEGEQPAEEKKEEPFKDVQLERAVDILTAILIEQERREGPAPAEAEAAAK